MSPRVSLWLAGMSLGAGGSSQFQGWMQAGKGGQQLLGTDPAWGRAAAGGGAGWLLGVEQDEAMTQPSPGLSHTLTRSPLLLLPRQSPGGTWGPGDAAGDGAPRVCVCVCGGDQGQSLM